MFALECSDNSFLIQLLKLVASNSNNMSHSEIFINVNIFSNEYIKIWIR